MKALLCLLVFVAKVSAIYSPMESAYLEQAQTEETRNVDSAFSMIYIAIDQKLSSYKNDLEARFVNLETMCQEAAAVRDAEMTEEEDEKVHQLVENFIDQMLRFSDSAIEVVREKVVGALNDTLTDIDVKLQPFQDDIADLKSQISKLATQDEMANLQEKISAMGIEAANHIKEEMDNLPTRDDLETHNYQLGKQLEDVSAILGNMSDCEDPTRVQQILEKLTESGRDLEELNGYVSDAKENSQCQTTFDGIIKHMQALTETMTGNSQSLSGLEDSVKTMQGDFIVHLEKLDSVAQTIAEASTSTTTTTTTTTPPPPPTTTRATTTPPPPPTTTRATTTTPPPPTTTTTTATRATLSPAECVDSTFIGSGKKLDVCAAAVNFRKCNMDFVAFHCCRSCAEAGYPTTTTSYKAQRTVPILQALKSFRPSKG